MARLTTVPPFWDQVEPHYCEQEGRAPHHPCYSKLLKADLLSGTFVLLAAANEGESGGVVARIVKAVESTSLPFSVQVNIFKNISEVGPREGILFPQGIDHNHLKHLPEVVQTTELRVVSMTEISNLAFVFTEASLHDVSNLFFTCQGMAIAFLLRFRFGPRDEDLDGNNARMPTLTKMPSEYCLPFPSLYESSKYNDCFACRIWNSIVLVKLEMAKLLGRYSQQQGLYGKECARLFFTAETWGFLCMQCSNLFSKSDFGVANRIRLHRVVESGLVVKAARIQKTCSVMRFSTKTELQGLCRVFGESTTAGQRCRLPKISSPKGLWINDVINVVCGADACEPVFTSRTSRDGIDLEFDGVCELFITMRYTRYAYTKTSLSLQGGCDPLLSSLICRLNPYNHSNGELEEAEQINIDDKFSISILHESEFEDDDGCVYRVASISSTHVSATCVYPKRNNTMYGCEKLFGLALTKDLIQRRLTG